MRAASLSKGAMDTRLKILIGRSIISTPVANTTASTRYIALCTSNARYSCTVRLLEKSRPWLKEQNTRNTKIGI